MSVERELARHLTHIEAEEHYLDWCHDNNRDPDRPDSEIDYEQEFDL